MMTIEKATGNYEQWLAARIPLIPADLQRKHELMAEGRSRSCAPPSTGGRRSGRCFARARKTLRRCWASATCTSRISEPGAMSEGRLIWGINDFDEAEWIPSSCDLVRLATSAHLAVAAGNLHMTQPKACKSILNGYGACLKAGGKPLVLAEDHPVLRHMAVERLKDPQPFWRKLQVLPELKTMPPANAVKGLRKMLPDRKLRVRLSHRVSGLGSLGRQRFVALADFRRRSRCARSQAAHRFRVVVGMAA